MEDHPLVGRDLSLARFVPDVLPTSHSTGPPPSGAPTSTLEKADITLLGR